VPASPSVLRVLTSLRLGERVIVRSDDGLLAAEYALFDGVDLVLRSTDPVSVREAGFMTIASDALARLDRLGVTPALAEEAAQSFSPEVAASYARGATARNLASRLGAYELFDGATYSAAAQRYHGAWLDLESLAGALPMMTAPILLQALFLATALSEVGPATPVYMSTLAAMRDRRPGERTYSRVHLAGARDVPAALRRLVPAARPAARPTPNDRQMRKTLLARVRERLVADSSSRVREHVARLESALAPQTMQLGPLADPELQAIERQLASGDARGITQQLDELERARGNAPGIRYLRARAALLRGEEAPRSVAQVLSTLAEEDQGFHEANLVAARSWLAAGEDANARFFARRVARDVSAPDSERVIALEILDETTATAHSHAPPAAVVEGTPTVLVGSAPLYPSLGDAPPPQAVPEMQSLAPQAPTSPAAYAATLPAPPADFSADDADFSADAAFGSTGFDALPPAGRPRTPVAIRYDPELVESLALPMGASESQLGTSELPRTPLQARIAMTRLSRDLGRDYRLWYGKTLRCNILAIDAMQQHLTHRFGGAPISDPAVSYELRRHGALLSEILVRALGAGWVDIGPSEPGYWAMLVPPATRTWPIGRLYRFVALGHHERDLVSYYLDIETRARQGA
jgi:hypothetical protein